MDLQFEFQSWLNIVGKYHKICHLLNRQAVLLVTDIKSMNNVDRIISNHVYENISQMPLENDCSFSYTF